MREFSPGWLNLIGPDHKAEVQEFLTSNGISLDNCCGFTFEGSAGPMACFLAKMYKLNAQGQAQWDRETNEPVMDEDREFWVRESEIPQVIRKALQSPA